MNLAFLYTALSFTEIKNIKYNSIRMNEIISNKANCTLKKKKKKISERN